MTKSVGTGANQLVTNGQLNTAAYIPAEETVLHFKVGTPTVTNTRPNTVSAWIVGGVPKLVSHYNGQLKTIDFT